MNDCGKRVVEGPDRFCPHFGGAGIYRREPTPGQRLSAGCHGASGQWQPRCTGPVVAAVPAAPSRDLEGVHLAGATQKDWDICEGKQNLLGSLAGQRVCARVPPQSRMLNWAPAGVILMRSSLPDHSPFTCLAAGGQPLGHIYRRALLLAATCRHAAHSKDGRRASGGQACRRGSSDPSIGICCRRTMPTAVIACCCQPRLSWHEQSCATASRLLASCMRSPLVLCACSSFSFAVLFPLLCHPACSAVHAVCLLSKGKIILWHVDNPQLCVL